MKINLSFFHKFSDRFFRSNKIINPKRDWIILLILFFVMIAGALSYDAIIYKNIANGEMYVSVPENELQLQSIDSVTLQNVVNDFESRQATISGMKIKKLIDPSL